MLRPLVLFLLLANLAWFAWAQGLLAPLGFGPTPQREPQRLERQLRPELLRVEPPPTRTPPNAAPSTAR